MSLVDYAQILGTCVALAYLFQRLHKAETRADALEREIGSVRKKAAEDERHNQEALRAARDYYDEHIKRHEGHIETLKKAVHMERKFVDFDTRLIDVMAERLERIENEKKG